MLVADFTIEELESLENLAKWWCWGSIISGFLAIAFTCCVCCYWEDLHTAIDVIDASMDFLADTYRLVFTPMMHFIIQMIVLFVWLGAMCCVVALNDIEANETIPQMKNLTWKKDVWWMSCFMFFGLLWLMALFDYLNRFIVITSASTYYWNNRRDEPQDQKPAEVLKSWKIAYCSHLGSVAIGAFIIAVIRFIKYTFVYMCQKIESATSGSNAGAVISCFFKCATAFLEYIERVTDYINESAYCYIAVTGDNFCTGALQAMYIKIKYMAVVAFATFLAKIFIFIGKAAIIFGNCALFDLFVTSVTKEREALSSITAPMIVCGTITYLFVSLFIGMFDESVNAMLTCVAIDTNKHNTPIYGPETFNNRL